MKNCEKELFERIDELVNIRVSTFNSTERVNVKNVEFKVSHVYSGTLTSTEVTVTEKFGFLRWKRKVVFNAKSILDFKTSVEDFKSVRYLPGKWEDLIEEIV